MNIDQFELNYLVLQEELKSKSLEQVIPRFRSVINDLDEQVLSRYHDQVFAMKQVYIQLLLSSYHKNYAQHHYDFALNICTELLKYVQCEEVFLLISQTLAKLGYVDLAEAYLFRNNSDSALYHEVAAEIFNQKLYPDEAARELECSLKMAFSKDKEYKLAGYKIASDFSGWDLLESRFEKEHNPAEYPDLNKPRWTKDKPKGTILVHWEQGFGDTIMFCRFLKELIPYSDKIYLAVRKPMLKLMQENFDFITVVDSDALPEDYDYHIPIMSLIKELDLKLEEVKGSSYLNAKPRAISSNKKKIGIAWQGAPAGMPERNMQLLDFEPLIKRKDIQLYSFQKGLGLVNASSLFQDLNIIDLGSSFNDFYDTASALKSMDLVISTDNCIANLSGALGIPTILLLNHVPEYRWMNASSKTFWYDSVQIIRQAKHNDWNTCISEASRII